MSFALVCDKFLLIPLKILLHMNQKVISHVLACSSQPLLQQT